jgi:hypothetical protein
MPKSVPSYLRYPAILSTIRVSISDNVSVQHSAREGAYHLPLCYLLPGRDKGKSQRELCLDCTNS